MDITEFEKRMKPRAKRSRLEPFQAQIFELKAKGYANWQISEYLKDNGLAVSKEAVRKFILSRESDQASALGAPQTNEIPKHAPKKIGMQPMGNTNALDAKALLGDLAKPAGPGHNPIPKVSNFEIDEQEKLKK